MGGTKGTSFYYTSVFLLSVQFPADFSLIAPQGGSFILKDNTDVIRSPGLPNILSIWLWNNSSSLG